MVQGVVVQITTEPRWSDTCGPSVTGNCTQIVGDDVVVVLDLGVGQRGALHRAPHHRLGAAVELVG